MIEPDTMPHPPEIIWRPLTEGPLIEQWQMKNDFQPVAGHLVRSGELIHDDLPVRLTARIAAAAPYARHADSDSTDPDASHCRPTRRLALGSWGRSES